VVCGGRSTACFREFDGFGELRAGDGATVSRHTFECDVCDAGTDADDNSQNKNFTDNQPHGIPSPIAGIFPASPNRRRICAGASCLNSEFPLYRKDKFSGRREKKKCSRPNDRQKWRIHPGEKRAGWYSGEDGSIWELWVFAGRKSSEAEVRADS
jgi:hypothetical protein